MKCLWILILTASLAAPCTAQVIAQDSVGLVVSDENPKTTPGTPLNDAHQPGYHEETVHGARVINRKDGEK